MRKIAVIGAGQAGLLLAIGLIDRGYRVTLVSDRTPEQVLASPIPAGSIVFHDALEIERELGLDLWPEAAHVEAARIEIAGPDGAPALVIGGPLDHPAVCVDQRLKIARWIEVFEKRGGQLVVKAATVSDLEGHARAHDLVVIAAGRAELAGLFPRDEARSPFHEAPRHISMVVIDGLAPWSGVTPSSAKFRILPGIGEVFSAPIYMAGNRQRTFTGFEAIPGGPMDRVVRGMTPAAQLALSKEMIQQLVPWDYPAIRDAVPGEERDYLCGWFVPVVRRPVATLPSGAVVMGIADTVNLADPIAAQGANNAAKMARLVRDRVVERGDQPFDAAWMEAVFEEGWDYLRYSNALGERLLAPPEPHMLSVLGAASQNAHVASRVLNGFNHPPSLFPWFAEAAAAEKFLAEMMSPPA